MVDPGSHMLVLKIVAKVTEAQPCIFNGLRPGSAAPTHLGISARDERKHACTDPFADTKTDADT